MADALDLLVRISVFHIGYKKLPLRYAIVSARATFDTAPAGLPSSDNERSILVTWLLFFLSALGPAGKVVAIDGIPGTKSITCVYAISIIIRSFIDMVPDPAGKDKDEGTADEFGLAPQTSQLGAWKARIIDENGDLLESVSWILQAAGFGGSLAVIGWIAYTVVRPLADRLQLKQVSPGSIHHFLHWLRGVLKNILLLVPIILVVCLFILLVFSCIFALLLIAYALSTKRIYDWRWRPRKEIQQSSRRRCSWRTAAAKEYHRQISFMETDDMKKVGLYAFGLTWMFAGIAFFVWTYDRSGTSRARVPEALG